jgi:hypothetical protein
MLGVWEMARPEGFEPPAPRFVVWCSIQLSYGRGRERHRGKGKDAQPPPARAQTGVARLPPGA